MFKKERSIKYLKKISIGGTIVMTKERKFSERLIVKELGYLKIPQKVKDEYGTPTKFPNPEGDGVEKDGKLIVTYTFDIKEIEKLQSEKGE